MADAVAVNLEPALYGCRHESWRLAVHALRRPLRGTRRCEHRIVPLKADDTRVFARPATSERHTAHWKKPTIERNGASAWPHHMRGAWLESGGTP